MSTVAAPPAPPAPSTTPPGESPGKIVVPSMKELAGVPAEPPPTPQPPAPKPGVQPPGAPGAGEEEEPIIPTAIVTPHGKTAAEFAKERRQVKGQKMEQGELETQYAQTTALLQERETELEKIKAERDRLAQEKADFERLANTREGEINTFREKWSETHRVGYNPETDDQVHTAHQNMVAQLQQRFPTSVPGKQLDGDQRPIPERVFAETILNDPAEQDRLHGVLAHYATNRHHRNNSGIDIAVNMMAQILGADVKMEGTDSTTWKTLRRGDPTFDAIEGAMASALPHFQSKIGRLQQIAKEGPKFAVEQYQRRATQLQSTLATGVFLEKSEIQRRLQTDPNDPIALFSAIVAHAPDLKTRAEARLGRFAQSFAAVSDELNVPTMRGNTQQDINAHMQEVEGHRGQLADIMRYAVVGANVGEILSTLIAERDAALERANRAATNQNPGPGSQAGGDGGATGDDVQIPTRIVTA